MDKPTFSGLECQGKKRKTRRELFLERMDGLIPWQSLENGIRPFYPRAGRGRHPCPLSVMLRVHCVQLFYNLSDPGMEDLLCESDPVRRFAGLKLSGPLPGETAILNFRHLLERHGLGQGNRVLMIDLWSKKSVREGRQGRAMKAGRRGKLLDYFEDLEDPRIDRCKRRSLSDIITIAICAGICGAGAWVHVEMFGRSKEK